MNMSNTIEVKVPDIGDFSEVEVIEVLVSEGDAIAAEQSLITVESDKASMEIPADQAGKVVSILVKIGDKVSQGTPIVRIEAVQASETGQGSEAGQASEAGQDKREAQGKPQPPNTGREAG